MSEEITPQTHVPTLSEHKDEKALMEDADLQIKGAEHVDVTEEIEHQQTDLQISATDDLQEIEAQIAEMSMERAMRIARELYFLHKYDQNFPRAALDAIYEFTNNEDVINNPLKHQDLIHEVKTECVLATSNSPYIEVRSVVDPTDNVDLPIFTFRTWVIGSVFAAAGSFVDSLFIFRFPPISVGTNVGQLLAYPAGKFLAKVLPDWRFRMFGREHSLNPGPFNAKEHMLITIMCSVSFTAPYTTYIYPAQAMPVFFNEKFAFNRGYQYLNCFATNMIGYGIAGLTRRFIVYPAYAIWPGTLNTLALIKAFHAEKNEPVRGPFGRMYTWSREQWFLMCFIAMAVYYWFPGFIFQALSNFSWITWIAPNNATLDSVCGFVGGMGLNPWPTFDFNNLTAWINPLTVPTFAVMNMGAGILLGAIMALGIYFTNAWETGYLPINGNSAYDNTGNDYNVSMILDANGEFSEEMYQAYSQPWMGAGFVTSYFWYFALYSSTITYMAIFHRHDVALGYRGVKKAIRQTFKLAVDDDGNDELAEDIHYRLMQRYKEVPEWHYGLVLLIFLVLGMVGVGIYPTHTSPVVLIFGLIMPLLCIIPCGVIQAVTGVQVPLNVLAEFIGGSLVSGNANALMYFKTYGYITVAQALSFSNDLKLAHYSKIPPRYTFWAQMWATVIFCIVSASVMNLAMSFPGACTPEADFKFTCAYQRTFFTASIFWGTLSPKRLFGPGRRYNAMLIGFPVGVVLVLAYWAARKRWPKSEFLRQVHPVMFANGPATWGSPYNMSYYIGNMYITWLSFQYIRKRYLSFWAKYNYVLAAAFPTGIAVTGIILFFGLSIPDGGIYIDWWGNNIVGEGCEGLGGCPYLAVDLNSTTPYFGPAPGTFET